MSKMCSICHKKLESNPNRVALNERELLLCDDCYAALCDFIDDFTFDVELDDYISYCERYNY